MRRILVLAGVILALSISAAAQAPTGVGGDTRTSGHTPSLTELSNWQVSVGYQYNQINLLGNPFNINGINASAVRFFDSWFGVEGQVGAGFGNTGTTTVPPNLSAKALFAGAGPHLSWRHYTSIEPWIHGVVGMEHFRFTQTAGVIGADTALAWQAGGGVDFHITPHMAIRAEADYLGSYFFATDQRHFQAVAGIVFDF